MATRTTKNVNNENKTTTETKAEEISTVVTPFVGTSVAETSEPDTGKNEYERMIADNAEKIKGLEDTIEKLQLMLGQMAALNNLSNMTKPSNDEVTIIFNTHGKLRTVFPTWTLSMSTFGQRLTLTKQQFQELANNHRKYFDRQYILLDSKHMDLAQNLHVPIYDATSKKFIKPEDLDKIGKLSVRELEEYYDNLSEPMQRTFIGYFMSRCNEKDPDFYNVDKMSLMNSLTKGNLFDYLIKLCVSERTK